MKTLDNLKYTETHEWVRSEPDGTVAVQKAPVIDIELCIGCGICENKCPVMDDPAIFVTSVGETRSETNRLLLDISSEAAQDPYK